jgi:hypothetical protein
VQASARDLPLVRRRLTALGRLYAPLGAREGCATEPVAGVLAAEIGLRPVGGAGADAGAHGAPEGWLATWGGPFPRELSTAPAAVIHASDAGLRAIRGVGGLIAAAGGRATLVTSPVGPTALYIADANGVTAWSTHAAAAAWLCHGRVELDAGTLAELLVTECVGGEGTHLAGVHAVGPAQRFDIAPGRWERRDYWPLRERCQPGLGEREARAAAGAALLEGLDARLSSTLAPACALTAGRDSRVVAVAMRELGREFEAITWGEAGWPDVAGARTVAGAVGAPHSRCPLRWNSDGDARTAIETAARWSDGLEPTAGLGAPELPAHPDAIVTGRGGESGRAFLYRLGARNHRRPSRAQLVDTLVEHWPDRLRHAAPEARARVRETAGRWIDAAAGSGHEGWRLLDVVYAEQRLRRWDRTRLIRQRSLYVPAFSDLAVQRALIALPLEDRLTDGFHRAFLAEHAPELVPPPPPGQRRGVPRALRRLARRLRSHRPPARPAPWAMAAEWSTRPATRDWIADELLRAPVLAEGLGQPLVDEVRRGFLAGEARATESALVLAAPAALAGIAARELRAPS